MGLFIVANGGDDCVHIDTQAGEVRHVLHGSNASDSCLSFCLVGISKIHYILGCSFHLVNQLAVNQTCVPLGKENKWLNRIFLEFKAGDLFCSCSKMLLKDLRSKDLGDNSDQD